MKTTLSALLLSIVLWACTPQPTNQTDTEPKVVDEEKKALIERALSLELDTEQHLVPGDPESHHACGFAKILCSAVFVTGLDFDFAAEAIGYFSSPYEPRQQVKSRKLFTDKKKVEVTLPNGTVRTAIYTGGQGCVCLGEGEEKLHFQPKEITVNLPDASTQEWPMGDLLPKTVPTDLDQEKIQRALDMAFEPAGGLTAAMVVTHKGRIIGERYKDEIDMHTSLESWSMGKSLTAMLMGILIERGVYELEQSAPIPEWQEEGDPRQEIRIMDLMRMSSGIRFRAPQDPDFDSDMGYPDHLYVYTSGQNTFQYLSGLGQQWKPNTVGRYRNCDPGLTNYLVRLGVEGLGEEYLTFPQRALFDKIGVRNMVVETDPYGNFLLQGYEFGSARDWARLGNLVLNDGVWNGERILYEGFLDHSMQLAPAWEADGRPIYGGNFHWINGEGDFPVPRKSIYMAGAGGQFTIIIPSHDLVIVRLGHYKGSTIGVESLRKSLKELIKLIPATS